MMDRGIRKGEGGICPLVASHRVALRYIALRMSDGFVLNSIVSKKTKKNNKGSDIEETCETFVIALFYKIVTRESRILVSLIDSKLPLDRIEQPKVFLFIWTSVSCKCYYRV